MMVNPVGAGFIEQARMDIMSGTTSRLGLQKVFAFMVLTVINEMPTQLTLDYIRLQVVLLAVILN